ncbi:Ribosomal protein L50 mitochondria [Trinorchestia longiramus]|nr:Ribosomal protein L50 mitochondria [Trinorchestia longiramus]
MNCGRCVCPVLQSVKLTKHSFQRRLVHAGAILQKRAAASPKEVEAIKKEEGTHRLMDFDHESLAARGYLRAQKGYDPPVDAVARVQQACMDASGTTTPDFSDPATKFAVLNQCSKVFNHRVLNSYVHSITTVDHLIAIYLTPVDTRVPLDRMRDIDLPKNLHVIYDYVRFHPDTDTKFGGITAFPGTNNIVTGLKERKKYKGFVDSPEWLRYNLDQETDRHGNLKGKGKTHRVLQDDCYQPLVSIATNTTSEYSIMFYGDPGTLPLAGLACLLAAVPVRGNSAPSSE